MLRDLASILLAFALILPQTVEAQTADSAAPMQFWASGSMGTSTTGLSGIVAGTVHIKAQHLVTGRVVASRELRFELFDRTAPREHTWEAGLLYGQAVDVAPMVTVTAAAGLGVVGGVRRGEFLRTDREVISEGTKITPPLVERTDIHKREHLLTVGLPLEIRVAFRPVSFLGVGVLGFANVNSADPFAGVALQVQTGWWK